MNYFISENNTQSLIVEPFATEAESVDGMKKVSKSDFEKEVASVDRLKDILYSENPAWGGFSSAYKAAMERVVSNTGSQLDVVFTSNPSLAIFKLVKGAKENSAQGNNK